MGWGRDAADRIKRDLDILEVIGDYVPSLRKQGKNCET